MKTSTQTDFFSRVFGYERAVELLARVGYDAIDLSMFHGEDEKIILHEKAYAAKAKKLKSIAADCGIEFNQAHAPFPSHRPENEKYNKTVYTEIIKSMEIAALTGAKNIIVHPATLENEKATKEFNMEFFKSLEPYCKDFGIKIALENMWVFDIEICHIVPAACGTGKEFAEFVDELGTEHFTACLDVGHVGLSGESMEETVRALGHNRLTCLHVHDNDHNSDMHTIPFSQKINWPQFMDLLREINYSGDITLEADNFLNKMPEELIMNASKMMLETAKYIAEKVSKA